ncbi:hypothetical protein F4775DRAFT_347071 [Biscogniauxia sp. FL1348]|nr:hypothetical protein F4775DRAFT_347071 [Biscogniauxia sp. FL1348]
MAVTNGVNGVNRINGHAKEACCKKRLLISVIDEKAEKEPEQEVFSYPRSSNPRDGWVPVTFREYANAINYIAHKIIKECGPAPVNTFPTIAYIGPNDGRYYIIVAAAVKAGYKALFISPRNSQEGQLSLFKETNCQHVWYSAEFRNVIEPLLQEREMQAMEVSSFESWLPKHEVEPIPYNKTFEQAEWEPFCVLHTSGSTGIPKHIVAMNGMLAVADAYRYIPDWNGHKFLMKAWAENCKRSFIPMPLFHAAGMYFFLQTSIYWGVPVAIGIADRPLTAELAVECIENLDIQGTILPPAILEDISANEELVKKLTKLSTVLFGGGDLSRDAGNRLVKGGVPLVNAISATEFCPYPFYYQPNHELWRYFIFNSELFGAEWRKAEGEEDVYRLVIVRKNKNPGFQGIFYTFPEIDEYDTKDLYRPHPTLPDHWAYHGRSDNIIVFSNGEKLNPITIEHIVEGHPKVKGAMVVGSNRFQPALIVEPVSYPQSEQEAKEYLDSVFEYVKQANKETVAHGQIGRQFVVLANPEKPFLRAGKGTVQKAGTIKLYQDDINKIYDQAGEVNTDMPEIDVSSEEALIDSVEKMFQNNLGVKAKLEPDTDFFTAGIDSMQVINASRLLKAGLSVSGYHVDSTSLATRVIYSNPTPRKLAQYILSMVHGGADSVNGSGEDHDIQTMRALWQKYTTNLPSPKADRPDPADEGQTVLLTGSTGMLGSYMLAFMVSNPAVKKVVCLNRAEDGGKKQQAKAMRERGLPLDYESKAEFWHADMSRSDFGLPKETYERLLSSADRFIHNAWPVNFNIPVESFEPHLRGVRNIADFATYAAKRVAVVFISSIGTGDRWDTKKGPFPEQRMEDLTLPSLGYGRSKMVGSLILEDAAKAGGFEAAIIRVGQVAGPEAEAGCWNRHEWLPSIIASSLYLGALPKDLGAMQRVDWTPCEKIAKLVLEVGGVAQRVPAGALSGYFHGVNPASTTWSELAPAVQEFYGRERIPELVSFEEWVARLARSQKADSTDGLDKNPGVKLLDSYRGFAAAAETVTFDMTRTKERSPTMREAQAVTPEIMKHWCKQWGF